MGQSSQSRVLSESEARHLRAGEELALTEIHRLARHVYICGKRERQRNNGTYCRHLHLRHHPCFVPLPKKLHEHACALSMRPLTSARRMLDDFVKNREQTLLRIAAIEEISASKKLKT